MKTLSTARLLSLALATLLFASCQAEKRKHAINLIGGAQAPADDSFDDLDEIRTYGLEGLLGVTKSGLGIEGGYLRSDESKSGLERRTDELYIGARGTFRSDKMFQPYISGGATWIDAKFSADDDSFDDDDGSAALYGRLGVGWQISIFQVGLDYRVVAGSDIDFDDVDTGDLDYHMLSLWVGLSF